MSVSQWKVLSQLKDTISRVKNEKYVQNLLSKDVLQVLDKIPVVFQREFYKYFDQFATDEKLPTNVAPTIVKSKELDTPKWKDKRSISKSSVLSQTQHALVSIVTAENDTALIDRIEAFILHLKQHPEGGNFAIRGGAIRILLRIRKKSRDENIQGAIREALALLGYSNPVPSNGIRILSMDGGGIRGLLILEMLKKLEELTGQKVHEMFDIFCGVSTGAILSFSLGIHHKNLDEVAEGYKDISMEVFKQSTLRGTGNLVWSHAYYDTSLWENKLREHLGTSSLISTSRNPQCPKLCAISAVVNQTRLSAYVFRNYSLPWKVKSHYFGGSDCEVWQAARASAAAPTYFQEFKLGKFLHQDGGIILNNPTAVALHEAKLIWPNTPIQCVVSFGTGRTVPVPNDFSKDSTEQHSGGNNGSSTSWANKFLKILDSATDTEGVHIMLSDLLPNGVYYRFNPYLTEMISMVEINPQKLEQLERDAIMYLRRNEDKFQEAARVLTEKKSFLERVKDGVNFRRDLYGL